MSACAAVGCDKHQRRDKDITFFNLPSEKTHKDKERRLKWLNIIKNKRKDELPKKIVLCENHFSDEMFDESREMQIRMAKLQEASNDETQETRKIARKLKPDALPDIMPHSVAQNICTRPNVMAKVRQSQMVDSMVKVGSVEPEPEPDDFQSHEELSFENFQSLPSAQSPVQPSENVMVEMVEKSIQTDNRVKTIKTRAKGVQTVQLERPTPDEHVTKNQTVLDDSFDADFERVFNTKEIDTLADTLGLPSLPATIRKFYRQQDHQPNGSNQPIESSTIDSTQPIEIEEKVTSPPENEPLQRYSTK
ncbi:uncharacterized protein [Clytia hemisphaerica]|uniref:uncharacterized protein n=1 Tax=Clytia hemisphaerica TaxID=252671 RepID=UPI0034D5E2E8